MSIETTIIVFGFVVAAGLVTGFRSGCGAALSDDTRPKNEL